MTEPVPELRLPRLPSSQADWSAMQVWWQKVVEQIEATVLAINSNIDAISEALAAAVAAQAAADAAQDDAIAALAASVAAQATADGAVSDASAAQADATSALTLAGTAVQQDVGSPWSAPTGTASRAAFASYVGQTISAIPTQAEVQAIDDYLVIISQRMKALVDDLRVNRALTP